MPTPLTTPTRTRVLLAEWLVLAVLTLMALPAMAVAQERELAAIDSLIAQDDLATARDRLESWWSTRAAEAAGDPRLRAHALFLRARLETDPKRAGDDYLAIALGTPAAPQAPAALLYLAQGLTAIGEYERAAGYLERLIRDYPASTHHQTGRLWLIRLLNDQNRPHAACAIARRYSDVDSSIGSAALIEAEAETACKRANTGTPDQPFPSAAEGKRRPAGQATTTTSGYALQLGAFRGAATARALVERVKRDGFEPRIVFLAGSKLRHVRIGHFKDTTEAQPIADRVRAAGYDLILVNDLDRERDRPD